MKVTISEGQVGGGAVKDSLSAAVHVCVRVCVCACVSGRVAACPLYTAKWMQPVEVLVALYKTHLSADPTAQS